MQYRTQELYITEKNEKKMIGILSWAPVWMGDWSELKGKGGCVWEPNG